MSNREQFKKILLFLERQKISSAKRFGARVPELIQQLRAELEKPLISVNSINTLLDRIQRSSENKLRFDILRFLYGEKIYYAEEEKRTPKSAVCQYVEGPTQVSYVNNFVVPMRPFKK